MHEMPFGSLGQEDHLEEGIATHSSILAWRTPWTEEPGGPQSRRSDMTEVTEHAHTFYFRVRFVPAQSLQSCLTLCDPIDCSLPGSSVHGILQAGILEWLAIFFSRGSS